MRIKIIFLLINLMLLQNVIAKSINYYPKALQKELSKKWNLSIDALDEINMLSNELVKEGKFYKLNKDSILNGFVFVGRIYSCRAGGCEGKSAAKSFEGYEYFDAYIIFDKNKTVKSVKVYNYQATHGHEITSKGWLKQFIDFSGENRLEVGKDIDSISGATISVQAITDEVNYLTEMLKFYK